MAGFKKVKIDPARAALAQAEAAKSSLLDDPPHQPQAPGKGQGRAPQSTSPGAGDLSKFGARQNPPAPAPVQRGYEIGAVYEVPLGAIRQNPVNPRVIYTSSSVDEMALSLTAEGQQVAATAFIGDDGAVTLIDGEKRLRAARAAGLAGLRVEIRPRPENDRLLYESARSTNLRRSEQSPLDDALRWKEMLAQKIYPTQGAMSQALGVAMDVVSRTLSLAQLPQRVIHGLAEEPELCKLRLLNAVREFWEACGEGGDRDEKTLDLIAEISRKGLGYREVEARRRALIKGPAVKPRAIREPLKFGQAKGELKTFPDGRLELSLKGLDEGQAEQLRLQLGQKIRELAELQG